MTLLLLLACAAPREGFVGGEFLDTYEVATLPWYDGYSDTILWEDDVLAVGTTFGVALVGIGAPGELTPLAVIAYPSALMGRDLEVWEDGLWAGSDAGGLALIAARDGSPHRWSRHREMVGQHIAFGERFLAAASATDRVTLWALDDVRGTETATAAGEIVTPETSSIQRLYWQDPYLFVGTTQHGALVYDVTDPANAVLVRQIGGWDCQVIEPIGDLLAVGHYTDTVLWDAADPTDPRFVGVLRGMTRDVQLHGDYVYGVGPKLEIADISDPEHPVAIVSGALGTDGQSILVTDDAIFVSTHTPLDGSGGGLRRLEPNTP